MVRSTLSMPICSGVVKRPSVSLTVKKSSTTRLERRNERTCLGDVVCVYEPALSSL